MQLVTRIQNIWSHAGFQKYFKNTGWMFAGQMTTIVSLFINIWIARHLGPTHFGSLSYIFAFVGMFAFISNLGIQEILVRDSVKYPERRDKILSTAAKLFALSGLTAFCITTIATIAVNGLSLVSLLIVLYATIFLWSPTWVIPAYFQSIVQAKQNAIIQMIGTVITSLLKGYLITVGAGIIWLTMTFVLDYVISGLLYLYSYKRHGLTFIKNIFDWDIARQLLHASYALMLTSCFVYLTQKVSQIFVKFFIDETALGLYAAAIKLADIWNFIPLIIGASLFPAIINAKHANTRSYHNRLRRLTILFVLLAGSISAITTILAPWIVPFIFGSAYISGIPLVQIYIWTSLGSFLTVIALKYLLIEERIITICIYTGIAAGVTIALNLTLIPYMGVTGAAVASIISYSIFPLLVYFRRDRLSL